MNKAIMIFNSFFEYGFVNKKEESNTGSSFLPQALMAAISNQNSAALAQNQKAIGEEHFGTPGGDHARSGD